MGKFVNYFVADVYYASSKQELNDGSLERASEYIVRAVTMNPNEPTYQRQRAKILLSTLIWNHDPKVKEGVLESLEKAYQLNTKNLTTLRNVIPLYYFLTVGDISKSIRTDTVDSKYLPVTRNYYSTLKNTYDNDLGIYADIAEYEKRLGLEEDFSWTRSKAEEMRADVVEWHESFRD